MSFEIGDLLTIPIGQNFVLVEQNSKITRVITDMLGLGEFSKYRWYTFRLDNFGSSAIRVLLFMNPGARSLNKIRRAMLVKVRQAGEKLDSKCTSRQYNLCGFCLDDDAGFVKIYRRDYEQFVVAFEMLLGRQFYDEHNINSMFFYACYHGNKNDRTDILSLFRRVCIPDCPYIMLFQIHIATLIKSLPQQVIVTDFRSLARSLREIVVGSEQINCFLYPEKLIQGCGGFT